MIRRFAFAAVCLLSVLPIRAEEEAVPVVPAEPPKVVQASSADELMTMAGQTVTVEGKVSRIGTTTGGGITFINMGGGVHGFVAVVFKANYEAFTGGFDAYKDKTLQVTGKLEIFKETTPQIAVKSPDQVKVVADAAPSSTDPVGEVKPE
jgi:hypothetical protein